MVIRTDSAKNISIIVLPILTLSTALKVPNATRPSPNQRRHAAVPRFAILDLISIARAPKFCSYELTGAAEFASHVSSRT